MIFTGRPVIRDSFAAATPHESILNFDPKPPPITGVITRMSLGLTLGSEESAARFFAKSAPMRPTACVEAQTVMSFSPFQ